ncbi:hypothetical protein A8C56_01255 [Niabella ginsenosidivorans]|uniref:Rubredoxin-like domain-containing protein n=1 Tax=Niabella ginsenosidivorans TaxID=1176587 RepID=A0A1A9HY75_9BACT|nr:rubredoxin [Niabella ginsenosidivorans]ANH79779.1 hypothetical protein A8C56_01255 [Niabella ginsenosidivorans]
MRKYSKIKINFAGGIISPGLLYQLLEHLEHAGVQQVSFGLRQQLLTNCPTRKIKPLTTFLEQSNLFYEINNDAFPNIVTSCPAEDIFIAHTWLSEGTYKDILNAIDYPPRFKINISDSHQSFTPLLTGNINWVASASVPHFWHLLIRFPKTNTIYEWDKMVYTNDIARLSKEIEALILNNKTLFYDQPGADGTTFFLRIQEKQYITKPAEQRAVLPEFNLPYYEGLHKHNNRYWLGVYRRDELFPVAFLKDLCSICLQTKIGQLCSTPWKSVIVKGIEEKDKHLWNALLNIHTINMRHAANELNFQVEDNNSKATRLKQYLVKELNNTDTRTFGLCIGIKTRKKSEIFSSILVKRKPVLPIRGYALFYLYDILCAHDYNPNKRTGYIFRSNLPRFLLAGNLRKSLAAFYDQCTHQELPFRGSVTSPVTASAFTEEPIYQCAHCLTVYDATTGDPENGIPAGTAFATLPHTYTCSLCEANKDQFIKIEQESLNRQYL